MQGKNHVALALAVPLSVGVVGGQPELLPATIFAWGGLVVGSLAPDIDGGGQIARWGSFLPTGITPKPLIALLNGIGTTISNVIRSIFGHRQVLHWPLWGLLAAFGGQYLNLSWLLWFGVGYILHIFGDSLTKAGVPIFGPISNKKIRFTPMKTGGKVESFVGWLIWLTVALMIGKYLT